MEVVASQDDNNGEIRGENDTRGQQDAANL
jgi:hypothetical protein